jgi:hypothetical protein
MYADGTVTDTALNPDIIQASIESARARRDKAYAEYESAVKEIEWLEQGLSLWVVKVPHHGAKSPDDALLRELLPDGAATQRPTMRQAMILVMRAGPRSEWPVADILQALTMNGWAPNGDAMKRVSDMAGVMVGEGHLTRTGRGVYKLSALLAGALERAMPPITDYRIAAAHGLPTPAAAGGVTVSVRPAASEGLSDE